MSAESMTLESVALSKSFGPRPLWSDVSLQFAPGSVTALGGPSGCGKTTLLNCLSLLDDASSGRLLLDGRAITKRKRRQLYRTTFGFLFQSRGLVEQDTVERNLRLSPRLTSLSRREATRRIDDALDQVGVRSLKRSPVFQLSGGEHQRVAFARLIVHGARIVFADEPTASLDEANAGRVIDLLREHAATGGTVICSTHDPAVIQCVDQVIDVSEYAPTAPADSQTATRRRDSPHVS